MLFQVHFWGARAVHARRDLLPRLRAAGLVSDGPLDEYDCFQRALVETRTVAPPRGLAR